MNESASGEANKVVGMDPAVVALLKEEYFHLQKTVEDFDQRSLTIKAWSITTSMAGIAASFLNKDAAALSLLAALSSAIFWMIEVLWKAFQQCYYPRIRRLEEIFSGKDTEEKPFRINKVWSQTYHSYKLKHFIQISLWPHVMLPHVIVVIAGVVIWMARLALYKP